MISTCPNPPELSVSRAESGPSKLGICLWNLPTYPFGGEGAQVQEVRLLAQSPSGGGGTWGGPEQEQRALLVSSPPGIFPPNCRGRA